MSRVLHPARSRRHRRAAVAGAALAVVAPACVGTSSALATIVDNSVEVGKNITVLHNIDMVAVHGYEPVGTQITVTVIGSGGAVKGSASGPSVGTDDGAGIEVNHGVDGTPQPGDCWDGSVPDIVPGDTVRVTANGDTDEVLVDTLSFTGAPRLDTNGDVVLTGVAKRADGTAIPASALDSGEFRSDDGKYRANPDRVTATAAGAFELRYQPPYNGFRNDNGLTQTQRRDALLTQDGHAIGFGHTDPLPLESQLIEGFGTTSAAADGCPGAPPEEPDGEEPEEPDGEEPEAPGDTVAPTVTAVSPLDGATAVAVRSDVTATFDEDVEGVDAGDFTLTGPNGRVTAAVSYDAAARMATLNPDADLAAGTRYTAEVAATVQDIAGNALTAKRWTFTTVAGAADTVAPTVTRQSPRPDARGVREQANITATFSEPVRGVDGTSVLLTTTSGTRVQATVTLGANGRTVTLDPRDRLTRGAGYTVDLSAAIQDQAGNALAPVSWRFTVRR
ncbi:MAG TPA: Ig-like domain-containing protein [Geodermatophilus sp.]|nr:Ig-like domain-containing protein [Geodermatophilus sp.]